MTSECSKTFITYSTSVIRLQRDVQPTQAQTSAAPTSDAAAAFSLASAEQPVPQPTAGIEQDIVDIRHDIADIKRDIATTNQCVGELTAGMSMFGATLLSILLDCELCSIRSLQF